MHDLLEGVCGYDLALILFDLIHDKRYFSLETLNNRIVYFDYGPIESSNAVPQIKKEHLITGKLRFSSLEMLCFFRYFELMLGDLVPEDTESWHLYLVYYGRLGAVGRGSHLEVEEVFYGDDIMECLRWKRSRLIREGQQFGIEIGVRSWVLWSGSLISTRDEREHVRPARVVYKNLSRGENDRVERLKCPASRGEKDKVDPWGELPGRLESCF
ncbi:hypothetical protein ALC57_09898 [Trachymyrmex cornetzi]|uniref:Uncharacterized protein n=1 Tax=Trachymyrmex cornetzi TaxID=471704 RepID=A0A151J4W5_9HYME|nr:hypothetical protein ALC57_09898 [Trachymyrmex cornetzi]